jgi:hypothetical protein
VEIAEGGLATAAQLRRSCASVSGSSGDPPSKVRVGLAPERSGDASRPGSGAQNGLASAAAHGEGLRQWVLFCRLIRTGWAPIYRGNPSTRSGRGDELNSMSNLNQMRWIVTELKRG